MATTPHYTHWHFDHDEGDIVWLSIDTANSAVNVLSAAVFAEFDTILTALEAAPPRGLVIQSAKRSGFIAGADVKEFTSFADEPAALAAIRTGQTLFDRLEALACTTVCLIQGYCLGGGLELALACDVRVADDSASTRLGLPEVRLGIHPGFGGSLRMIRTVGPLAGLDAMLTGRTLSTRAARKIGLVDYAVPERHLRHAAQQILQHPPRRKPLPWLKRAPNHHLLRPFFARLIRRKLAAKAPRAHYPAPYALLELWVRHGDKPKRMLREEAASVARLLTSRTAQNLIRVFQLQEQLKTRGKRTDKTADSTSSARARHVHVIGGGVMGGDIAAWCALQGLYVTVQEQRKEALARVLQRGHALFKKRLKGRLLVQAAMDRLIPDEHGNGLGHADVVIEAIFEDVEAKQTLFREIEPKLREHTLVATNTSSIPLQTLGTALHRPQRLVGLHFFNPVASMQLVEVVNGPDTDPDSAARAAAFTRQIARLPLPVTSTPGFLVNRILMPYLMEAMILADEGVPLRLIDKAATDFGMPMGPIELADTVGLDICLSVADILATDMAIEVPKRLRGLVQAGRMGRKSGRGFYEFKRGKPVKPSVPRRYTAPTDVQDRLMLRQLNEAVACLRDGVVENADLLDAGVIFGTGFAPFRGGPLHYIHCRGSRQLIQILEGLQQRHGERFAPDAGWSQLVDEDANTTPATDNGQVGENG